MLGEAIGRQDVRKAGIVVRLVVWVILPALPLHTPGVTLLAVERIPDQRFLRFIMSRQRTVGETAGNEDPTLAVRLHDEGIDAGNRLLAARILARSVGRRLVYEIRLVVAGPFPFRLI